MTHREDLIGTTLETPSGRKVEVVDGPYQCAIPTQTLGPCRRPASVHFAKRNGTCVAHVCRQHAKGAGAARVLLPLTWEYDHIETYGR